MSERFDRPHPQDQVIGAATPDYLPPPPVGHRLTPDRHSPDGAAFASHPAAEIDRAVADFMADDAERYEPAEAALALDGTLWQEPREVGPDFHRAAERVVAAFAEAEAVGSDGSGASADLFIFTDHEWAPLKAAVQALADAGRSRVETKPPEDFA